MLGAAGGGKACRCLTLNYHYFSPLGSIKEDGEEGFSLGYIKDTKAIQVQLMYDYIPYINI